MFDVCLLVEGSYPYVQGGVSSWLHTLVTNLKEIDFIVVPITSPAHEIMSDTGKRQLKYILPPNVTLAPDLPIYDVDAIDKSERKIRSAKTWKAIRDMHQAILAGKEYLTPEIIDWMRREGIDGSTAYDLLSSPQSWQIITDFYQQRAPEQSFIDYFWTYRFTHLPFYYQSSAQIPDARVYHSIGVGFGGYIGGLAKLRTGRPLILTEHGIYVREREIEIAQTEWIFSQRDVTRRLDFFQEWWVNMFRFATRFSYDLADEIIAIASIHRRYQLQLGANPDRLRVVPNGINMAKFVNLRYSAPPKEQRFTISFVGRIVPIKDVKTFIRAIKNASTVIDHLLVYIIGGTEEDEEYSNECAQLVDLLDLNDIIQFTGSVDVTDYYRKTDVVVLTSLSEGQPLVILEAQAAGIPVVASDVGACHELLFGSTREDQALGESGIITPPVSPNETANAIIRLWREPIKRQQMGQNGRERVKRFYQEDILYQTYREIYQKYQRLPTVQIEKR